MKKLKTPKDVTEYISRFPAPVQKKLKQLRSIVKKAAPGVEEKIGYGVPGYKFQGMLLYFAAHKKHIGLYAMPSAMIKFARQLTKYEVSKGTIKFADDQAIPISLVERIVRFRVKENIAKKKGKKNQPKMFR